MVNFSRRKFIRQLEILSATSLLSGFTANASNVFFKKDPTILVVSGWQDVNIGDIAHTPGLLHILETFLPNAKVILWKKSSATDEVKHLLTSNFPKVKIIYGNVDTQKNVNNPEIIEAFKVSDIMVHGSGPSVVGQANLEAWTKFSDKPFGLFGVTIQNINENLKNLLSRAAFIYTRETASLKTLENAGLKGDHISFAPDATFYMNIHNQQKAAQFLKENGLEPKKFICAIPRLRYTPYHQFRANKNGWTDKKIKEVEEVNNKNKEWDHAKMREAIITWVRETGNKVLVCPEMVYQVDIMNELLIDPLPSDVKPNVVKRGYWLPDEAASVYAMAHTVMSFECHSPIIAAVNKTPMLYLRQPEDTIKGQMYYDLGYSDWVFEIEQTEGKQIADRLRQIWTDYPKALKKIGASMKTIEEIYSRSTLKLNKLS